MNVPSTAHLLDLTGQRVLVTGGTGGIGEAIVRRFSEAGASVALHYRSDPDRARAIAEETGAACTVRADLTVETEVQGMVAEVVGQLGAISVLVNNAGIFPRTSLKDMSHTDWRAVIEADLDSAFLCTRAVASQMNGSGAIINVASIEGIQPAPLHSHYGTAKAGLVAFTRAAANELAPIRVNAVSPGLIWREGIEEQWPEGVARWEAAAPLTRLGQPDDVADACLFFAAPAARWITGQNLCVDGGVTVRPLF